MHDASLARLEKVPSKCFTQNCYHSLQLTLVVLCGNNEMKLVDVTHIEFKKKKMFGRFIRYTRKSAGGW